MFVFLQADTPEALDEPLGAWGGVIPQNSDDIYWPKAPFFLMRSSIYVITFFWSSWGNFSMSLTFFNVLVSIANMLLSDKVLSRSFATETSKALAIVSNLPMEGSSTRVS